jgi:hypothetical protein
MHHQAECVWSLDKIKGDECSAVASRNWSGKKREEERPSFPFSSRRRQLAGFLALKECWPGLSFSRACGAASTIKSNHQFIVEELDARGT